MANPLEVFQQISDAIDLAKNLGDKAQNTFSGEWLFAAGKSLLAKTIYEEATKAGPPPWLAKAIGVSEERASSLYKAILFAAINRENPIVQAEEKRLRLETPPQKPKTESCGNPSEHEAHVWEINTEDHVERFCPGVKYEGVENA